MCLVTELVDGESDFIAAMLAAIVFAAFMGWPSCTVADCPAVLCYAALSEVLGRFWVPAAMLVWAALSDGYGGYACCVAYSLEFLFGATMMLASLAVENTRLFILLEMVQVVFCVENWVPGSSSQKDDSDLFEWVEVESYEPEPPCTMVDDTPHVNDLVGEARRRGWCEHELMYHIFEYGVPEGFYSMEAHMKAMASAEESAETVLRGRRILELAAEEEEANSVVFPGGVLHEDNASVPESPSSPWQWPWAASGEINMWNPLLSAVTDVFSGPILDDMVSEVDMGRLAMTCHFSLDVLCMEMHQPHNFLPQVLCLDLLIPANEVSKACVSPEPVKSVQILFRGGHGLGVWDIEPHMTLTQWFSGGKQGGNLDGYFSTIGGRILNSDTEVCNLGLGNLAEVVFHGRLRGGSFAGVGQGGGVPGTGEFGQWTCSNCGKNDCWSTRYSCYRCGCPRYFDMARMGQVHAGQSKVGGIAGFHSPGVGGGMSGIRLVGALGRDQTYVSPGNPSYRKNNGRRGGAREGGVPGAGVGPGSGGNRVKFQAESLPKSGVGVDASDGVQMGDGKSQRDKIIEAVQVLRLLLGQEVCSQVEDLIQEHIPAPPKVTPPHSPTELERAQHLAKLLEDKAKLEKKIQGEEEKVSKAKLAVAEAEDDLSISQQELRGLTFQIDAHHREDDARREKNQSRDEDMEGVLVEEVDSGEEVGVQVDGGKRRRVNRFGAGSSPPRTTPSYVMELIRGMSAEDQATFQRNYGPFGGDDGSLEGDKPPVGVHGQDMAETPCL